MTTEQTLWEAIDLPPLANKLLTNEQLVEQYLKLSEYWWTDKTNSLYNKRDEAKLFLLYWLEHGDEPEGHSHFAMVYVLNNFCNDYLRHFSKVEKQ